MNELQALMKDICEKLTEFSEKSGLYMTEILYTLEDFSAHGVGKEADLNEVETICNYLGIDEDEPEESDN